MKKKLALLGGKPILGSPLPEPHYIGKEEIAAALKVLKTAKLSGFVAKNNEEFLGGPWIKRLERGFCDYFGAKFSISVNSATSGLYAAVYAIGICPGDEVIVSPYTMSASATAILACSGVPVFVDVDIDNYCIDADKIEAAITAKTKAIIVVHLFGNPAEMDKIMRIAKKYNLRVIEDCAQAPGVLYKKRLVGTFGDAGIFSLNRHKTIQTGEGGIIVTDNKELALKLQLIRNHAEDIIDQMGIEARFNFIGWNYKMTELEAAIGTAQITKLDRLNSIRIKNAQYLTSGLKRFDWIIPYRLTSENRAVYYRYPFRYIKKELGIQRSTLIKAMQAEGLPINGGYVKPIYLQAIYKNKKSKNDPYLSEMYKVSRHRYRNGLCPVAEKLYNEELLMSTITHTARNFKEVDFFIMAIEKIEENIEDLMIYEKEF